MPAEIVGVATMLASAMRLINPTAAAHSVRMDLDPVSPGIRVRVNEADLQHVLLNLLLNAVQACGPGGRVRLGAVGGEETRISVTDDGCGIAPEDQKRIFEPFCSLRKGGTGLGLFLSLDLLRRWGGEIRVRSTPGVGSTFEVVLPSVGGEATEEETV